MCQLHTSSVHKQSNTLVHQSDPINRQLHNSSVHKQYYTQYVCDVLCASCTPLVCTYSLTHCMFVMFYVPVATTGM